MTKPITITCFLASIALHGGLIQWGMRLTPNTSAQLQAQQGLVAVELNLMPAVSTPSPASHSANPKAEPISPPPEIIPSCPAPAPEQPVDESEPTAEMIPPASSPEKTEQTKTPEPEPLEPVPAASSTRDLNAAEEPIGIQQLAKPSSMVPPVYPRLSRRRGEEGVVIITCTITANGEPRNVAIKQGSGFPLLDKAALLAMKRSRYTPAQRKGVAVSSTIEQVIEFTLEGK